MIVRGNIFIDDEFVSSLYDNPRVQEVLRRARANIPLDKESNDPQFKDKLICGDCSHQKFDIEIDLICLVLICDNCKKRHCLKINGSLGGLKTEARNKDDDKSGK